MPTSVTSIGASAFLGTGITGALYANNTALVYYPPSLSGPFTVPDSVTSIEDSAFFQATGLTEVIYWSKFSINQHMEILRSILRPI